MNVGLIDRLRAIFGTPPAAAAPPEFEPIERLPAPAAAIPLERRARQRVNARRGTKVLVIDDSRTILVALRKMLLPSGFLVAEALDGEAGLEQARNQRPDLIFLDIVMPGMNGFAALRSLRRDPATQDIPVIMMSGNEHATEQFFGSRIPADDFMKKPFSRLEVFARIEGLLDQRLVPRRRNAAPAGAAHH
jgi:twitching motility two-component system response regulator PilH